jgi:hypothetical protein
VDDLLLWNLGTGQAKDLAARLSAESGPQLTNLLIRYRRTKEIIAATVAEVDAASICRRCGGQCCLNGKYRINVFDVLARLAAETTTAADFYRKPSCPYGSETGCLMEPGLRPADCVLFICDAIARMLPPKDALLLAEQEAALRECLFEASRLAGEQLGTPLLLWAAHTTSPILKL